MDITITPDTYMPSVDAAGNYIDNIPIIRHGLYCPCGSRKDKTYDTATKFASHIKSKSHQKWLTVLNQNKANYYVEMLANKEIVENQKQVILKLQNQLCKNALTIDYLTDQLTRKTIQPTHDVDLLSMDT